jgi:hypothetical protein
MKIARISAIAILALTTSAIFAQSAPTSQSIQQRKANQQNRVAHGLRSGQMTAHETGNVERRESSINHQEHNMRRADNGHLTAADKAKLNHRQNRVSKSIYRDKHNAAVR